MRKIVRFQQTFFTLGIANEFHLLSLNQKVGLLAFSLLLVSCGLGTKKSVQSDCNIPQNTEIKVVPAFNADSAYSYVARQCSFGPRVPGSEAHSQCLNYLVQHFNRYNADTVIVQSGEAKLYDGNNMAVKNIIASYNLASTDRVLFCAHWDSRPFADSNSDKSLVDNPIIGANDGASGVGIIMELARLMADNQPSVGVDLILFDVEDWGAPHGQASDVDDGGWILGSRYWSEHPHSKDYKARYGVLLDMVGASGAAFYREYISDYYASSYVDKIWTRAAELGMSHIFINTRGGAVTDDHIPVNQAGIPCVNIIHYIPDTESGFFEHWHTHNDNIDIIDRNTLGQVGLLLTNLIYNPLK